MYREETLAEISHFIQPGNGVILGLSGGGDSVYLLHALREVRDTCAFPFLAVHIHHGLRGQEADADEKFAEDMCRELRVPFLSEHVDVRDRAAREGMTLEQAGRASRYEVFYREAERMIREHPICSGVNIFLAHHANDQEETVLMNLLRGSGPAGLAGMRSCREVFQVNGKPVRLVRPLLHMTHQEILSCLREEGICWREDATNQDPNYTRNRLRTEILPRLKEISAGFTRICGREAALFADLADYMDQQALEVLAKHMKKKDGLILVPVEKLLELHPALRRTVARKCLELAGGLKDLTMAHGDSIDALLRKQSGRQVRLPGGLRVCREFDQLCFWSESVMEGKADKTKLIWGIEAAEDSEFSKNLKKIPDERYTKWLDYDKIVEYCGAGAPVLRHPLDGDYLLINSQGQKKSLALYLKQEKIPQRCRTHIQVVAWGGVILWVPGHRDSPYFFITGETKRILRLQVSLEEKGVYDGRDFNFDQ